MEPARKPETDLRAVALRLDEIQKIKLELEKRKLQNKIHEFKPYPKQKEFMASKERTCCLMAGNRLGKSFAAIHVLAYHLTGLYPDWWEGLRFTHPIDAWAVGVTAQKTRDVLQRELLGDEEKTGIGTGILPKAMILEDSITRNQHQQGAIDGCYIRHITGGLSRIEFKAMKQGMVAFMGTKQHFILLDEESDEVGAYDIFSECKTRTANYAVAQTLVTYTPLRGLNDLAKYMIDGGAEGTVDLYHIGWDDVPESILSKTAREELLRGYRPHEIEARTKGTPLLSREGAIYPFIEREIVVEPFLIPSHWKYVIGLDVARIGYYAAVLIAVDPTTDTAYVINEYKEKERSRASHIEAINAWGQGIYIGVDKSAQQGDIDGSNTLQVFRQAGCNIHPANLGKGNRNGESVEGSIQHVFDLFSSDRLKIFKTCTEVIDEYRMYRYHKGKVYKHNDHCMDAMRYACISLEHARPLAYFRRNKYDAQPAAFQWTPGDAVAGY